MLYTEGRTVQEDEPLEKIKIEHLMIPFVILGVGTIISLFVFFGELYVGKLKTSKLAVENSAAVSENNDINSIEVCHEE